jgi:hypothetical protein
MKWPIDLHIVLIAIICGSVLLLLHRLIPTWIGACVLNVVLQCPLLTRMADRKDAACKLRYLGANELVAAIATAGYIGVRLL